MIPLDDPLWLKLRGQPARVVSLLTRLVADPALNFGATEIDEGGPFLVDQGSVHETAIAAVPYLIHAASRAETKRRIDLLQYAGTLAGLIASKRSRVYPGGRPRLDAPHSVWESFDQSLSLGARLLAECLSVPMKERDFIGVLEALAGFHGHSRVLFVLNRAKASTNCAKCDHEFEPLVEWNDHFD